VTRVRALPVAILAAAASTVVLAGARLAVPAPSAGAVSPQAALPLLMASAATCVAALTVHRQPAVAWLSSIAALAIATIDLAAMARTGRGQMDQDAWHWLSIGLCLTAILASTAAVAFASERQRRLGSWVSSLGAGAIAWLMIASAWALGSADATLSWLGDPSPLGSLGIVTRSFLVIASVFVGLGLAGEARPAIRRARRRLEVARPRPSTIVERLGWTAAWARLSIQELAPGRTRARQAATAERSRIARELHAEVVPALRRALAEAERGGSVERLAEGLREVMAEVDGLVASRHSIVLEVDGLVPAIEWLAERTEDRSDVRVDIGVADDGPASGDPPPGDPPPGDPPADVAAAAYRVVELALDNAVRHAPGSHVSIEVESARTRLMLVVTDDGPGLAEGAERAAAGRGARGLADMRAEAAGVDAALDIGTGPDGRGTRVAFRWPS
jgi:signal transduction histidine kinase